jgi:uncharacterized protein (DUF427 family)
MLEKIQSNFNKRESVWDYPRPPAVEDVSQRIKIVFNGQLIVDSQNAKRVLETSHPPTYYIPIEDIKPDILKPSSKGTYCEWKGEARYYDVVVGDLTAKNAAWFYPNPVSKYEEIKDYVAFYANKMEACYVGDERIKPQDGNFYGGWITSNLDGPFKGGRGTVGW